MGMPLIQFFFSFLVTAAFVIATDAPGCSLICCGLSGALGWMIHWICVQMGGPAAFGSPLGSLGVAFTGNLFSRRLRMPVTIFNIPGMVPLVPGGLAHQAVRNLIIKSCQEAAYYAIQAIMIAGAIALGLVLLEVFNHNIRSFKVKRNVIILKRKKRSFK